MKKSELLRVNKVEPVFPTKYRLYDDRNKIDNSELREEEKDADFHDIFLEETRKLVEDEKKNTAFIDSAKKELDKKEKDELEKMMEEEETRERIESLNNYRRFRR